MPVVGRDAADRRAVDLDDRQARGRDLGEMQSERVDQEPVLAPRDQHREVVRDPLVEVERHRHPEGGGQFDPCLAFVDGWIHGCLRGRVIIARYRPGRSGANAANRRRSTWHSRPAPRSTSDRGTGGRRSSRQRFGRAAAPTTSISTCTTRTPTAIPPRSTGRSSTTSRSGTSASSASSRSPAPTRPRSRTCSRAGT